MAKHLQRLQPSFMPRKVRSTLQIMISFIFVLMSTRTEPYRNSISAKKKKKKKKQKPNQNKTKNLKNRFRFDCCTGSCGPLLVPRSARDPFGQPHGSIRGSGQTNRTWPVQRLPSPFRKNRGETPIFSEGRGASVHS